MKLQPLSLDRTSSERLKSNEVKHYYQFIKMNKAFTIFTLKMPKVGESPSNYICATTN